MADPGGDRHSVRITPQNITQHIRAIYTSGELDIATTCKELLQVRVDGAREVVRTPTESAILFDTSVPNVNFHLKYVFADNDLEAGSVVKKSLIAAVRRAHAVADWENSVEAGEFGAVGFAGSGSRQGFLDN